jgi:hypothetical protein
MAAHCMMKGCDKMNGFFDKLPVEDAERIEALSRLMFELRENRAKLLSAQGVNDDEALLARLRKGEIDEHPGYEHWLSARILDELREAVRTEMASALHEAKH